MADLKQHGTAAAIAAIVAVGAQTAMPARTVEKPVHVTVAASKHAWPDLSDREKAALAASLAWFKGGKVAIFCDGADCRDLQTDLDDAFEDAGITSDRALPVGALPYGASILYRGADVVAATHLAADVKAVTAGRLVLSVKPNSFEAEGLVIVIGKRPR